MSKLTKLNLLGLVNLSEIICDLKINQNVDEAIKQAQSAIKEVVALNHMFHSKEMEYSDEMGINGPSFGIASQNILEKFVNILIAHKTGQQIIEQEERENTDEEEDGVELPPDAEPAQQPLTRMQRRQMAVANGDQVIGNKDYMLVFVITCFLPFMRPSLPQIK